MGAMNTHLTRDEARQIDRTAIQEWGFPGIVLMENAGRGCVDLMQAVGVNGPVTILTGKGNNAGDGFVIARHLALRGLDVRVAFCASPSCLEGDAAIALRMMQPARPPYLDISGMHASQAIDELDYFADGSEWIVDALLGTGASGAPRPPYDCLIDWINAEQEAEQAKVLAVDVPSGLDCDTGKVNEPTVQATHTCTFVAPKAGFAMPSAAKCLGELHTVGIGLPLVSQNAFQD